MPSPAVDCHAHVFWPGGPPLPPNATYRPHPTQLGTADAFRAVIDAAGLTHALLVTPEPYRTDNTCMLQAIAEGAGRFRGIALVSPDITETDLDALVSGGVVGVRYNLSSFGMLQFRHPASRRLFEMLRERNLFLQVHCQRDELAGARASILDSGIRVMIDHFGRPDVARGIDQAGFAALLELGRSGNAVVKLSGPFRSSLEGHPYKDVDPLIAAAVEAFTLERCVWGSDWPFVLHDARMDYGPELMCMNRWFPDEKDRRQVLWETPRRLFGFEAPMPSRVGEAQDQALRRE